MEAITLSEILKTCKGELVKNRAPKGHRSLFRKRPYFITGISTDTRTIKKGDLFIALNGKNFDGHNFIKDAFSKGACGAVVERKINLSNFPFIEVKDTLRSLQDIASYYRSKFNVTAIGITGSNGKTTTKEITYHCISKKHKTLKNEGNFNNEIGVPLTLFNLNKNDEVLVLELATNNFGEIRRLAEISMPNIGCLLNISLTHTEFLKNIRGVTRAKQELVEMLPENGIAILNSDDKNVYAMRKKIKCKYLTFGIDNPASDVRALDIEDLKDNGMRFMINIANKTVRVWLRLIGIHNVYNALAAISCSYASGLNINEIKSGLESFKFSLPGRWNIRSKKRIRIIDDSYNANPESMEVAIKTFLEKVDTRKILVLGDMLELGPKAKELHRRIGFIIGNINTKDKIFLFTFGKLAREIGLGAIKKGFRKDNVFSLNDKEELAKDIRKIAKPGDSILVKGSNAMKMKEIINNI